MQLWFYLLGSELCWTMVFIFNQREYIMTIKEEFQRQFDELVGLYDRIETKEKAAISICVCKLMIAQGQKIFTFKDTHNGIEFNVSLNIETGEIVSVLPTSVGVGN